MNRRGFLGLFGLAAAAPVLAIDELVAAPGVAGAVELGVATPAEAAGGFLVPPNYLGELVALMKSDAIAAGEARADLGLAELAR